VSAVLELGYVGLGVSDLGAWRQFGTSVLGLEVVPGSDPSSFSMRMDYQHHRVIVQQDPSDDLAFLGLRVRDAEALQDVHDRLEAAGFVVTVGSKADAEERHVLALIKVVDPAGIPVEVFHGPRMNFNRPFHPGRPMHGKFSTGNGGLGHCFIAGDMKSSYDFYYALGLRGSVEYKLRLPNGLFELVFMHCSDRQHTIAFGMPQKKRINHLMIEADSLDDVGLTHNIVRELDIPITVTLGKHSNDQMFSFYFQTPSGWHMEYGCNGRPPGIGSEYYTEDLYGHDPEAPGGFDPSTFPDADDATTAPNQAEAK
jgi:2,3-dihydroxybiphenyl 1,2-dioxygenase